MNIRAILLSVTSTSYCLARPLGVITDRSPAAGTLLNSAKVWFSGTVNTP